MLSKKPAILLSACNSVHSFSAASGSTTSSRRRQRDGTRPQHCERKKGREYATIAGEAGEHRDGLKDNGQEPHQWPRPQKGHANPTPYQIFAMNNKASYTKARFYELVKLYHPDLTNGCPSNLSHAVKLERYRLIVAAHTILSDPMKRSAYDRFGAGWNGKAEVGESVHPATYARPGPFTHSWNDFSDPIWQNATWEDWEKFHAHRAREKSGFAEGVAREQQAPLYMQNTYFVALVMLLALMGGSANYNRAQDAGTYFIEQRDIVHDRAAKELRKVRQDVTSLQSRDERIQWFLRHREAQLGLMDDNDMMAMREEKARRVLRDREVCRSDGISGKDP